MTLPRWTFALLLLWTPVQAVQGQQVLEAEEHRVRAALLFNFAKFIHWPPVVFAHDTSPFTICVLGEDPVSEALAEIAASKRVRGRRIVSRVLHSAEDAGRCHILFYSREELRELRAHRARWARAHMLTVGETDGFVDAGGIVGLMIVENHFTFEVNAAAARQAGLEISAGLLDLASRVIADEGERR